MGGAGSGACVRQGRRPAAEWQRRELLQSVVTAIADRDPRLAIRLAESQGTVVSGSLTELIATQWSRHNRAKRRAGSKACRAGTGALRLSRGGRLRRAEAERSARVGTAAGRLAAAPLWSSMLGEMAKYDPDQALQIAQAAESPAQRAQAMGKVLAAIAQTNPSLAMTHLLKLPTGGMRSEILGEVARSVATLTPTAARLAQRHRRRSGAARSGAVARLGTVAANVEAAAQLVDRVPKDARKLDHGGGARLCPVRRRKGPPVGAPLRQRRVADDARSSRAPSLRATRSRRAAGR